MRKVFRITTKYIMGVMLFFIMVLSGSVTGYAYSAATQILPAAAEQPSAGCILVGVKGEYIADSMAALNRINEIRLEACREGVPNPDDPSVNLTMEDYVPIKWSAELEQIARIRAAEASLMIAHERPNGKDWLALSPLHLSNTSETLAWEDWSSSMVPGIDLWYEEKEFWNLKKDPNGAGHYTAMIRPSNTYVGLGCMLSEYGVFGSTLCGRFGSGSGAVDETMAAPVKDCIQLIEIQSSFVGKASLEKISSSSEKGLKVGDTLSYELVADTNIDEDEAKVLIMDNVVWASSDSSVATVDNYGNVTGISGGTATITAASISGLSASVSLTFTDDKVAKVSSLKVKAGKKKLTITWKKMAGIAGYELQISTKKSFKGAKTVKLGKNKAKYTAKKLKAKKKYYVRIRAYKTIKKKGKSKKVYGSWVKANKKTK